MKRFFLTFIVSLLIFSPAWPGYAQTAVPTGTVYWTATTSSQTPYTLILQTLTNASTGQRISGASVTFSIEDASSGSVILQTASAVFTDSNGTASAPIALPTAPGTYKIVAIVTPGTSGLTFSSTRITATNDFTVAAPSSGGTPIGPPAPSSSSSSSSSSSGFAVSIPNPIKCDTAQCLITQVIKYIFGIIAVLATFMFIWGGILMLTSAGNAQRVKQAKDTLTYAAIGIVVILLSWSIIIFVIKGIR